MVKKSYKPFFHRMGLLFLAIPAVTLLANIIAPDRGFSEKENRVLASLPEMNVKHLAGGRLSPKYESYVNDQFLFRDFWVSAKARVSRLLGDVEENGVYLCDDDYLIEAFTPPAPDRLDATLSAMETFIRNHSELNQYVVIVPNAVDILSDKLPSGAPQPAQQPYLDQVRIRSATAGAEYIDLKDTLLNHKDEKIYYQTDHHWTTQGAYYGYLGLADAMDLDTSVMSYEKLPVTYGFQGTLSAKSGFLSGKTEEIDVFLPVEGKEFDYLVNYVDERVKTASFYETDRLSTRDKYAMFFDGNHPKVVIQTPASTGRTLLVLKDSYANSLVPFLAPHYSEIILIDPRYFYGSLEEQIQASEVDDVLFLYNANTFFADTSLEMTLLGE